METEIPNEDEHKTSRSDADWDNRILCSDGSCIGVIGPDGNCKECGKRHDGNLPETVADSQENRSEGQEVSGADIDAQPQTPADRSSGDEAESDDWAIRQLCSDGNCIGVIGADGLCKECGKPFEG